MGYLRTVCLLLLLLSLLAGCVSSTQNPSPAVSPSSTPASSASTIAAPLPHFKCYIAEGKEPGQFFVGMRDQFGPSRSAVGPPKFLCTPVQKTVEKGEPLPVPGNADHLTCYVIAGLHHSKHPIQNQLDRQDLTVKNAQLLCVPTVKGKAIEEKGTEKKSE